LILHEFTGHESLEPIMNEVFGIYMSAEKFWAVMLVLLETAPHI
jgi:hypothetical protein